MKGTICFHDDVKGFQQFEGEDKNFMAVIKRCFFYLNNPVVSLDLEGSSCPCQGLSRCAEQHAFAALGEVLCIAVKRGFSSLASPTTPLPWVCQRDGGEMQCGVPHCPHVWAALFPRPPARESQPDQMSVGVSPS